MLLLNFISDTLYTKLKAKYLLKEEFNNKWYTVNKNLSNTKTRMEADNCYSVSQSYANSFWGDVVLDTFNNVSRDEDNILDQIYI